MPNRNGQLAQGKVNIVKQSGEKGIEQKAAGNSSLTLIKSIRFKDQWMADNKVPFHWAPL